MSEEKQGVPSNPPPPPYDEIGKGYRPLQANYPAPPGYAGTQPTSYAAQPGFQPGAQPPQGFQQGSPQFYPQGQPGYPPPQPGAQPPQGFQQGSPQFYPQGQLGYPPPQPYPGGLYPQGAYSGQQPYGQPMPPGQPYTTTQVVITQPGQQAGYVVTTTRPPDYLVPAILACFCCFCPTGLAAIFFAYEANKMALSGNMDGASRSANTARTLIIVSVVVGVILIVILTVLRSGIIY